jgi:hypothetical protein
MPKRSKDDVLRALVEEVASGNTHPDRAAVFSDFLEDTSDEQQTSEQQTETPEPKAPATKKGG